MGSFRRVINNVVGIVMLAGIALYVFNYFTAEQRVRELCDKILPGMTINQLRHFVDEHDLSPFPEDSGVSFVVEGKSFGRHGCKVIVETGLVKEANYNFVD